MENYSVKKLSDLAGVSVRTLHLYDEIGLLKPSVRTSAGYRLYGERELLRLQQVLFYKELDFSLQEIAAILDHPEFDVVPIIIVTGISSEMQQKATEAGADAILIKPVSPSSLTDKIKELLLGSRLRSEKRVSGLVE